MERCLIERIQTPHTIHKNEGATEERMNPLLKKDISIINYVINFLNDTI